MELNLKIQELRKQKDLTQEELAEILFVSRTAISKWESGRGYPSIDSLKALSAYFAISIDELLSSKELMMAAEEDNRQKNLYICDIVYGLLDCAVVLLLLLPLFSEKTANGFLSVSLIELMDVMWYTKAVYISIIALTVLCGILTLSLKKTDSILWKKAKSILSLGLSVIGCVIFIITAQVYVALFSFLFMLIKGALLIKLR